jgi:hypothetical protein
MTTVLKWHDLALRNAFWLPGTGILVLHSKGVPTKIYIHSTPVTNAIYEYFDNM